MRTHDKKTGGRRGRIALRRLAGLAAALFVLLAALSACGEEEDELSGTFGPGAGGTLVDTSRLKTIPLTKSDDTTMGILEFDEVYFTELPLPGPLAVIQNSDDGLILAFTRISGRADTPCRYSAAVAARDGGYAILGSGDRSNVNGLSFHQVNLASGAVFRNFYCTLLRENVGIQIDGISANGDKLGYVQVHFVLNSIRR